MNMRKITVWYKSRSSDAKYKAERHRNGDATCFCPGYVYQGTCWHVDQLKKLPKV